MQLHVPPGTMPTDGDRKGRGCRAAPFCRVINLEIVGLLVERQSIGLRRQGLGRSLRRGPWRPAKTKGGCCEKIKSVAWRASQYRDQRPVCTTRRGPTLVPSRSSCVGGGAGWPFLLRHQFLSCTTEYKSFVISPLLVENHAVRPGRLFHRRLAGESREERRHGYGSDRCLGIARLLAAPNNPVQAEPACGTHSGRDQQTGLQRRITLGRRARPNTDHMHERPARKNSLVFI